MPTFIVTGNYTQQAMKNLIDNPKDREEGVREMIEALGGKIKDYYLTTGEHDFVLIAQMKSAESLIPGLMVTAAAGTATNIRTAQAFTGADFVAAQKRAGEVRDKFVPA